MTENVNDIALDAGREAEPLEYADQKRYMHTEIKGRFNQYTSGFWSLAIPMLSARYLGRYFSMLFKLDKSKDPLLRRSYGILVGAVMSMVTGFYASRTMNDMKHVFAETLGYEFNKKPEDIVFHDLWKSKNVIVHRTVNNFLKYNVRRIIYTVIPFFNFFIPGVLEPKTGASTNDKDSNKGLSIYNSVDFGVGTTGLYLASDVISRKATFFEELQGFIDKKINHTDRIGELISASDLISLYDRHAKDKDPGYTYSGRMDTPEWKNEQILFGRMAELMNQTYGNVANQEKADFTVPKLIYLLGEDLIHPAKMQQSLTYIELASRYGMNAVKQVAKSVGSGMSMKDAVAQFPVVLQTQDQENAIAQRAADNSDDQPDKPGFAQRLGGNRNIINNISVPAASQAEKIAQRNDRLGVQGIL